MKILLALAGAVTVLWTPIVACPMEAAQTTFSELSAPEAARIAKDRFPDWYREWKEREPGLSPEQFRLLASGKISAFDQLYGPYPFDPASSTLQERRPLLVYSPDSVLAIDPFAGFEINRRNDHLGVEIGDGDAQCILYDFKKLTARIMFYSTVSGHEDAAWLSTESCIVVGTSGACVNGVTPIIYQFSSVDSTWTAYGGPVYPVTHRTNVLITPYVSRKLERLFSSIKR